MNIIFLYIFLPIIIFFSSIYNTIGFILLIIAGYFWRQLLLISSYVIGVLTVIFLFLDKLKIKIDFLDIANFTYFFFISFVVLFCFSPTIAVTFSRIQDKKPNYKYYKHYVALCFIWILFLLMNFDYFIFDPGV